MIKWIHNNKRSITVFLVASTVVLAMSFFGVDIPGARDRRYALKINDHEISFEEFQREKKQRQDILIQQYKRLLGDNFRNFAQQIYNMPNQDVADDIIAKRLLLQEAERLGLYVGEEQLAGVIKNEVFGGSFNSAAYAAYLNQTGQSARGFEERLRKELLIENLKAILSDAAVPSRAEVESFIRDRETAYDLAYIEFDPANFENQVRADEAELEKYYTANQTDYEIPASVQYNYTAMSPRNSMQFVEISAEDIEFYYSENEKRFTEEPKVKARQIKISIPKDASKEKEAEIKQKAEEAHSKASAGEKFEILVPQYSDDFLTVDKQGQLDWLEKGKREQAFEDAVFGLKGPGVAPLIETSEAYYIVKVDEFRDERLKPLDEVRSQIENELKAREAPAFISAKAYEIFEKWETGEKPLAEIAKEFNLPYSAGSKMLQADSDPEPMLKGLTKQVISAYNLKKQILDIGDSTVLVEVANYEEAKFPPFQEVKDKVLSDYKREKAKDLAREASEKFLLDLKAENSPGFHELAKAQKLKLSEKKGLSKAKPEGGIFSDGMLTAYVYSQGKAGEVPSRSFSIQGKHYLVYVEKITPPEEKTIGEKFESYREQTAAKNTDILLRSILNRLKAESEIDIDKRLLGADPIA